MRIHPAVRSFSLTLSGNGSFGLESLEYDVERRLIVAHLAREGVDRFSPHRLAGIVQGEGDEGGDGAEDEELET